MPLLLNYFIAGVIGIWINVFVVKIPKLQVLSKAANHPFSFKEYFKDDWPAIVGSNLTVLAFIWGWGEIVGYKPALANYGILIFLFVGFTGGSLALAGFSVASKKLAAIIDVKSNIADGIQPPVNASNVEGAKEIQKYADLVAEKNQPPIT